MPVLLKKDKLKRYHYNSPELLDLKDIVVKLVKDLKECAIGMKDIDSVLNGVFFKHELQLNESGNPYATFRNCRVDKHGSVLCNIGYKSPKYSTITLDENGNLYEMEIYKGRKLIIKSMNDYGGWNGSKTFHFELPEINGSFIDNYEGYIFQLSTTNEYYNVIDFVLGMQMKFQSNLYFRADLVKYIL